MLALIQRVTSAQVKVEGKAIAKINSGFLIFLGVIEGDTDYDLDYLVKKTANLRIMADKQGKMNLNLTDAGGEVLVVSQFTLAGDVTRGNRPSFVHAAEPKLGEKYYQQFISGLKATGIKVKSGQFGAYMAVSLVNDGPTTIMIDSRQK